jgi:hypothetical protein
MTLTNDQYFALDRLGKWYRKYQHQFIELSGVIGTGAWDVIQEFIEASPLDQREIIYLSYDQKQVLELAYRGYHTYYLNSIIYNYRRITDLNSLSVVNPLTTGLSAVWKKELRGQLDDRYKLMVVFDSTLLSLQTLKDLAGLELPIILIRDPMLVPATNSHTFLREPNLILRELNEEYINDPIVYFAQKILRGDRLAYGNYDTVSIVPKKQMNLYNLRSSEMNITLSEQLRHEINSIYRERIMNRKDTINVVGERVIVTDPLYRERLKNLDNKKVRLYLTKGLVGYLTKVNKHQPGTRFTMVDLRPDGYHDSFVSLALDRYYLNSISGNSRAEMPDEILRVEYAYALAAGTARTSHWDKTTVILDANHDYDDELRTRLAYTAVTRARKSMTIII